MARVLVVVPWARYTPHFETDLELAQIHIDRGDEVEIMGCDAELPACDRNPEHDLARCSLCIGRRRFGTGLLSKQVRTRPIVELTECDRRELAAVPGDFTDAESLRRYEVDGFDLGFAVLSSVISFVRQIDPTDTVDPRLIRSLLVSALSVYRSVQNRLRADHYDHVYVFNGRFAITRAVLRACQSRNTPCTVHERASTHEHYSRFEDTLCADFGYWRRNIRDHWAAAEDVRDRDEKAAEFFTERARGVSRNWHSFVAAQEQGLLPGDWDATRTNLVIFVSSEDEFASIGHYSAGSVYPSQIAGIREILASLCDEDGIHVYVRAHPNLAGIDNQQTRDLASLDDPRLTMIPAESTISSYALLRAADKVVTFGSTVGIEAVFWEVPSILVGQSAYRGLGGNYEPGDHDEVMELIRAKLEPLPKTAALMFGYYLRTYGTAYEHYQAESVFAGRFRGRRVRPGTVALLRACVVRALGPIGRWFGARAARRRLAALQRSDAGGDVQDLILVSGGMWTERWTTYQRIASELRKRYRTLYVEGNYSWGKIVRGLLRPGSVPIWPFGRLREVEPGFHVLTPPPRLPLRHFLRPVGVLQQAILRRWIRRAADRLGMRQPILWTFLHQSDRIVGTLGEKLAVYHCVDYWPWLMPRVFLMGRRRRIELDEAMTAAKVAFTVSTSRFLRARMQRWNEASHYVPNAADNAHFLRATQSPAVPADLRDLPRPILGFSGTLEAKSDLALLTRVAGAFAHASLVFVGHAENVPGVGTLAALPNVHFLGMKPLAELPAYLAAFDVCLVPFRDSPEIDSISPLKIFEYLASARPVVASRYAEIADLGDVVYLAGSPEEFVTLIETALAEDEGAMRARRLAFAEANSWVARGARLFELIDRALSGIDAKEAESVPESVCAESAT